MGATVTAKELVEDYSYEIDYKGIRVTRVFLVTCDTSTDPTFIIQAAVTCPGVPNLYDYHPTLTNLILTSIKCKPFAGSMSPNQFKLIFTYEFEYDRRKNKPSRNGKCTLEYGTVMMNIKVTRDANDNDMILNFNDPNSGTPRQQPAEFEIQVPTPLITFRRREPLVGTDYVALKLAYEGHINSRTFQHGDAHTWLCTLIEAQLNGDAYDVTYQFQYHGNVDPGSWDAIFFFKEPSGTRNLTAGAPAADISEANGGIEIFQVYPDADFNALNIY